MFYRSVKFTDFLYDYHTAELEGIDTEFAYAPVEIPAEYEKVRETILNTIDA